MKTEFMSLTRSGNKMPKHGKTNSRTERRKKERKLAKARRKADISERVVANPALVRFHF